MYFLIKSNSIWIPKSCTQQSTSLCEPPTNCSINNNICWRFENTLFYSSFWPKLTICRIQCIVIDVLTYLSANWWVKSSEWEWVYREYWISAIKFLVFYGFALLLSLTLYRFIENRKQTMVISLPNAESTQRAHFDGRIAQIWPDAHYQHTKQWQLITLFFIR